MIIDHCHYHHLGHHDGDHHHASATQCPARREMNANDVQTWRDNIYSGTALCNI